MSDYSGMFDGFGGAGNYEIVSRPRRRHNAGAAGGATILLSASTFLPSSAQATVIGVLSVAGGSGTYTFTLTATSGNRFQVGGVNGSSLQCGSVAAIAGTYTVTVHADNGAGSVINQDLSVAAVAAVSVESDPVPIIF